MVEIESMVKIVMVYLLIECYTLRRVSIYWDVKLKTFGQRGQVG